MRGVATNYSRHKLRDRTKKLSCVCILSRSMLSNQHDRDTLLI